MHGIQYGVANLPKTSSDSAREACIAKDLAFHASLRLGSLSGDLSRRSIAVRWAAGLLGDECVVNLTTLIPGAIGRFMRLAYSLPTSNISNNVVCC